MVKLTVLNNRVGPIIGRHPWVFSGALKHIPDGISSGTQICLYDERSKFLAQGYFNSYSQIAVRLWGFDEKENVDAEFFERRISQAYDLRKQLVESKNTNAYRLVHSENDFLPGLVVDKYGDYLCAQFHNRGIDSWKKEIVAALVKIIKPKGIYERSDVGVRIKEEKYIASGEQSSSVGILYGKMSDDIKIIENGYKFIVDISGGQKTGFFLDQRDKRSALAKYSKGKRVLNCFSYTGGFSVYALGAGAKSVTSVDSSQSAIDTAVENVKLNKLDSKKSEFVCGDVKEYLRKEIDTFEVMKQSNFDVIILDPPAFVKNRHKIAEGLMGYRKINEMAMRILPKNGILVSASCSQHVSMLDFRYVLSEAASHAGRSVQILESYSHGIDHLELISFTEGQYLKCVFALVR